MKKTSEKQTHNKLIVISAIIWIAVLAIGAIFIYMPFTSKNKSLRADILKERDKNILIGNIRALNKHIKAYDKRIPEAGGVSWLLSEVSSIAAKNRIDVSSKKPGNQEDYGPYTKLSVAIDIACTYDQLGRFISEIESSEKFLKVENIYMKRMDIDENFEKGSGKFKAFDVKANVTISTVVEKEQG